MDEQIRKLMSEMLVKNLANVEEATESLLHSLGQKHQCLVKVETIPSSRLLQMMQMSNVSAIELRFLEI